MARRRTGNMCGEQLLWNVAKYEVHDLDKEDTRLNGCQIDEIIRAGNDRSYTTLAAARAAGFDNCAKCSGASTR